MRALLSLLLALPASSMAGVLPFDPRAGAPAIQSACRFSLDEADRRLSAVAAAKEPAREAVLFALARALDELSDETAVPVFLGQVSADKAVRDAGTACEAEVSRWLVGVYAREDLYLPLKRYAARGERLDGPDARLLEKTLMDFKRNGLELPSDKRARVAELKKALSDLQVEFAKTLGEWKDSALFSPEQLRGLPADFIARLPKEGGKSRVSLDYPDFYPFMDNAADAAARKELETRFNRRGGPENSARLKRALALRAEAASLLGYPSWAHYQLEERMAKTPERAAAFLKRLRARLEEKARPELAELARRKRADQGPADPAVRAWDWRYYHNQQMKERYRIDDQEVKEYFPLERVSAGMLGVYEELLGLRFTELASAETWHPDAKLYEVRDASGKEPLAHFYMDLHPREGKYKHAAAFTLIQGRALPGGGYRRPVSAMVANFNKPAQGRPSLLTHQEVETFFHEFGHIMHQVLTTARHARFSGSSTARDFVEAPSQMLENWVWDKAVLERLSGHYQDPSRKLPAELLGRMVAAKNVDSGLKYLRQAFFATYDLELHSAPGRDPDALYAKLMEEVSLIPMTPGTLPAAGFGHLMGGYDAGYYGYLWSEVYAQDMFSRFEAEGAMSPALGRLYRKEILEPGGERDEDLSLRAFLGREPGEEPFLRGIGLVTAPAKVEARPERSVRLDAVVPPWATRCELGDDRRVVCR